ncbi:MAG: YlcI/YnfO family protein [Candidatus Nitrosopumilus sp. bin_68KS]
MSRTVSARIPTKLHDELRERCNLVGESINDFVTACIEVGLHNSCEFDFGDELVDEIDEKKSTS